MTLREEILKDLVTEYQETRSHVVFAKILFRVDKLLLKTIHIHIKRKPQLKGVEFRDLYQTAIIGLADAVLTVKEDEKGPKIIARIIAYVKSNINTLYNPNLKSFCRYLKTSKYLIYRNDYGEIEISSDVEKLAELALLRDKYVDMLMYKIVTKDEFELVIRHFGYGMKYRDMGKLYTCPESTMREKVLRVLDKIKVWFEGYGDV